MDFFKKLSILVVLLCVLIALRNQNQNVQKAETDSPSLLEVEDPTSPSLGMLAGDDSHSDAGENERLTSDFYRESCPSAEDTIRSTLRELFAVNATVAPQLLRLSFHDCFVSGCDASVLLDSDANIMSEKTAPPNLSLKGFAQIDDIKTRLELECPRVVSCADIVALAAREAVIVAGGNFYPVLTGRMDSRMAFPENATIELPSPKLDASGAIDSFAAKGFSAKEMIALLGGGHSTGKIHCSFMRDRLFNFSGTNKPDPSIDTHFLEELKAVCIKPTSSPSLSPSPSTSAENSSPTSQSSEDGAMQMDYEGVGKGFGEVYYRSLLRRRGLLFVDQQMTSNEDTKMWVDAYALDRSLFRKDFTDAMFKLTHLPGSDKGEVRLNCRKVNNVL